MVENLLKSEAAYLTSLNIAIKVGRMSVSPQSLSVLSGSYCRSSSEVTLTLASYKDEAPHGESTYYTDTLVLYMCQCCVTIMMFAHSVPCKAG